MSVNEKMKAIADEIRDKTGGAEPLTLDAMAENIPFVYEHGYVAGYNNGFAEGEANGFEKGKQAEYDAFWDVFQKYGDKNGMNYGNAFSDGKFADVNYNPKYPIITEKASTAANTVFNSSTKLTDTKVPFICKGSKLNQTFARCNIEKIVELNVHEETVFDRTFLSSGKITELNITGTIGQNGFNVQWSTKLNKASIESIINALSAKESGLTVTFSKTAVNNAFGIDIDDESTWTFEWLELRGTKSKWTFNYV